MEIKQFINGNELTIALEGELNSSTATELDDFIANALNNVTSLIFDFEKLTYLSSAGLRVLLIANRLMSKKGSMVIRHANPLVLDILEMTGFTNVLTVEN